MATRDIFIVGHGAFSERRGTTIVPKGCEVRFYAADGCTMDGAIVRDMLKEATIKCHDNDGGTACAQKVHGECQPVENMILEPLKGTIEADQHAFMMGRGKLKSREIQPLLLVPNSKLLLSEVMRRVKRHPKCNQDKGFRFHWLCCRTIIAPKVKADIPPPDPFAGFDLEEW